MVRTTTKRPRVERKPGLGVPVDPEVKITKPGVEKKAGGGPAARPARGAPPRASAWHSEPPFPTVMPVFSRRPRGICSPRSRKRGSRRSSLPEPGEAAGPPPAFFSTPGFVIFTSGSTGTPKPGFRSTRGLFVVVRTITEAYGLPRGARIAACLPLAASFGLSHNFLLSAYLGGHVGLLERFDHRSLLNLFGAKGSTTIGPAPRSWPISLVRAPLHRGSPSKRPPSVTFSADMSPRRCMTSSSRAFGVADTPELRAHRVRLHHRRDRTPGGNPAGDGGLPVFGRGDFAAARRRRRRFRPGSRAESGFAAPGTARVMGIRRMCSVSLS